ncbi:helix-turn-helix domain-containing protein [Phycicoccus flavus]|uniref:helix-turn-helix domain-containing protein n=1 Tax=Phycicoccus flavus TaxID=2502783 RepID=UPI000FEB9074|nr:helix-turn-helix transcriptional regulator [Phycicoccus flavus]NHA66491.1 helix-turn-helix transcriptional regulator [Phycicoccus flavus]
MSAVVPLHRRSGPSRPTAGPAAPEPLWREAVGTELREERADRGERLVDVAARAGVSVQYLSEVERGLKEPSSEVLAAVAGALDLTVAELAGRASSRLARAVAAPGGAVRLAA